MHPLLLGEEKKDEVGLADEQSGGNDREDDDSDNDSEELVDLPLEITQLIGEDRVFESEEELFDTLEKVGVGDLRVVLVNGKPHLVTPTHQHNSFTSQYAIEFTDFCNTMWGKWGCCSGTHKIHLLPGGSHLSSRDLDLSYWGNPRCSKKKSGSLKPTDAGSIPVVVLIQFSWKNKKKYKTEAIDDMMNRGLEHDHGSLSASRPTLGYLVKVRFSKKRTLVGAIKGSNTQDMEGLQIYRLPASWYNGC
ncbi:hypothetical protein SEMRO_85_G045490.1 [Seminavis robusta]|uniref:Uncharacterized protein n=1 Tax=Seminavis robusta TaxID=568900 RepID=A0A9N8DDA6_9STRA|nr:hypothetical protein SEMRO_85_G045490.1 [Seminavis robusta]|eukprot:Sro85_g045490.1 n/a (248) ;mRNA; r:103153-103896